MRHGENHVRMQALHRAPPQQPTLSIVKPEEKPAASVKPGQESCVRSSGTVTLSAQGPSDSWGRSPVDDQSRRGHQWSETTLTGESRFHISPPRGFEPVTIVAESKQVTPLYQWDMVRIMWECRLSTTNTFEARGLNSNSPSPELSWKILRQTIFKDETLWGGSELHRAAESSSFGTHLSVSLPRSPCRLHFGFSLHTVAKCYSPVAHLFHLFRE